MLGLKVCALNKTNPRFEKKKSQPFFWQVEMEKDSLQFEDLRWKEYLLLKVFISLPQGCYSCKEIHKAKRINTM